MHATGHVWIDNHGNWLWTYRFIPNDREKPEVSDSIGCQKAKELEALLISKARSLRDTLANLIKRLKEEAVTE